MILSIAKSLRVRIVEIVLRVVELDRITVLRVLSVSKQHGAVSWQAVAQMRSALKQTTV